MLILKILLLHSLWIFFSLIFKVDYVTAINVKKDDILYCESIFINMLFADFTIQLHFHAEAAMQQSRYLCVIHVEYVENLKGLRIQMSSASAIRNSNRDVIISICTRERSDNGAKVCFRLIPH